MTIKQRLQTSAGRLVARVALVSMLAIPGIASATAIDFSGAVTNGDGTQFSAGDPLTGVIQIDDAAAAPGSMFDVTDLLSFDFTVGSTDFSLPDVAPFSSFRGTVADGGASLSQFLIDTDLSGTIPGCGSCSLNLSDLQLNGSAPNSFTVQSLSFPNLGVAEGTLATSIRAANVPEPRVIVMFALGLLLLGWGIRRRATRPAVQVLTRPV